MPGNWEGRTILSRVAPGRRAGRPVRPDRGRGRPPARRRARVAAGAARRPAPAGTRRQGAGGLERAGDRRVRRRRRRPGRPPTLTSAARYRTAAERAAAAIRRRAPRRRTGPCSRSWKDGRAVGRGVLEDYSAPRRGAPRALRGDLRRALVHDRARPDGPCPRAVRRSGRRLLRHGRRPRAPGDPPEGRPGQRRAVGQRGGGRGPAPAPCLDRRVGATARPRSARCGPSCRT